MKIKYGVQRVFPPISGQIESFFHKLKVFKVIWKNEAILDRVSAKFVNGALFSYCHNSVYNNDIYIL